MGNPFPAIGHFFMRLGHLTGDVLGVAAKVIGDDQVKHAIELARHAAENFADTQLDQRREFVMSELMKLPGVSESTSRLLVELAVKKLKDEAHSQVDHLAEKADAAAVGTGG